MIISLAIVLLIILVIVHGTKSWWDLQDERVYTVIYDGSIFSDEHFMEVVGWRTAKRFANNWVYEHPHGKASIMEGPLIKGTGCMVIARPRHSCGFEACGACGGRSRR